MAVYQSSGLFPAEFATRSSREAAWIVASSRLAWMHHGTLKQNYIYKCHSVHGCALKKKGVPWCPGIPPIIGNRKWENDDGCALFSDKPTWLARFARASASPSNLQGPACFTALRTLALPAFMWTDDGYAKRNLQYPNFLGLFRYGKWWSTIGFRYRENPFLHKPMWHKL